MILGLTCGNAPRTPRRGVSLGGGVAAGQRLAGASSMICFGAGMSRRASRSRWGLDSSVRWRNMPVGPVKVPAWSRSRWRRTWRQVWPVRVSMMRMSSSASQHSSDVGADAFFEPVIDRAQVQDLLHVPPAAFDLQELLVAQRDVGGGQVRVGAAQQVLPVQVGLGLDLGLVDAQQPAGGDAAGTGAGRAWWRSSRAARRASSRGRLSEPAISSSSWRDELGADVRRRGSAASGLWQMTNRWAGAVVAVAVSAGGDRDLLDPHVVGDGAVAALAGTARRWSPGSRSAASRRWM